MTDHPETDDEITDSDIWLQEGEEEARAACGCRLLDDLTGYGARLIYCKLHAAAPQLLETLQQVLEMIPQTPGAEETRAQARQLIESIETITLAELITGKTDYIRDPSKCPFCGHWQIEGEEVEIEEGKALQVMSCAACEKSWRDIYTLADFREV